MNYIRMDGNDREAAGEQFWAYTPDGRFLIRHWSFQLQANWDCVRRAAWLEFPGSEEKRGPAWRLT